LNFFEGPLDGFDELANVRWSHHDDAILFLVPKREAGMAQTFFQISGTGPTLLGRNGEGDPYYTDGEIDVASLVVDGAKRTEPPRTLPPPPPRIALKDQIWHGVSKAVAQ
jgi:hypothetical protein